MKIGFVFNLHKMGWGDRKKISAVHYFTTESNRDTL